MPACPLPPCPFSPHVLSPQDSAEFGKIGKYYAVESMLLWDPETQQYLVRRRAGRAATCAGWQARCWERGAAAGCGTQPVPFSGRQS